MAEENLADEVAVAAYAGLVEDALEVLLHGVDGHDQLLGDLGRGRALEDRTGHVAFALGEAMGRHEECGDPVAAGRVDDDCDTSRAAVRRARRSDHGRDVVPTCEWDPPGPIRNVTGSSTATGPATATRAPTPTHG